VLFTPTKKVDLLYHYHDYRPCVTRPRLQYAVELNRRRPCAWAQASFYHWGVDRKARGGGIKKEEQYTDPAIKLNIPGRARLADVLCFQPTDLTDEEIFRRRAEVVDLMCCITSPAVASSQKQSTPCLPGTKVQWSVTPIYQTLQLVKICSLAFDGSPEDGLCRLVCGSLILEVNPKPRETLSFMLLMGSHATRLVAPQRVDFCHLAWTKFGSRVSLTAKIANITAIDPLVLK